MPASPRPRRLHHWGTNALIYIAQECTARGPRCLHLHVQEHSSSCARLRRCPRRRELQKMPASPRHTCVEGCARRPPCTRPRGCPRRHVLRASKRMPASPRHAHVCLWRASKDARVTTSCARHPVARVQRCPRRPRHPRVGLHSRRPKMAAST